MAKRPFEVAVGNARDDPFVLDTTWAVTNTWNIFSGEEIEGRGRPEENALEEDPPYDGSTSKGRRNFMAVLACETCRLKKTKCDEDRPSCGLCRSLNVHCHYPQRRITKKNQTMNIAINSIRRLETKLDRLSTTVESALDVRTNHMVKIPDSHDDDSRHYLSSGVSHSISPPQTSDCGNGHGRRALPDPPHHLDEALEDIDIREPWQQPGLEAIPFSQHRVLDWPAVKENAPTQFLSACRHLSRDYATILESKRAPLSMSICPFPPQATESWLNTLSSSVIKGLADGFFSTFNHMMPVLDRAYFYSLILGAALESDFGNDIETCLVLVVLALGCLAVKAHEEGDYTLSSGSPLDQQNSARQAEDMRPFSPPPWYSITQEQYPGLRFFNESRKRVGFLVCGHDMATCQYFLLSRAGKIDWNTWESDTISRIFWNILMNETILTEELYLPSSGLADFEASVPIPKFTPFPKLHSVPDGLPTTHEDESLFHLHFLAQAAHRIILTRIRNSLFFYSDKEEFPPPRLVAELHRQLELWRFNLPQVLQFSDIADNTCPRPATPAHAFIEAWLRSRYLIAKTHLGRPQLYKALHRPNTTTDQDLRECRDGLRYGIRWPISVGPVCTMMKSCMPLKFGWCSQFFGQILLLHAVARSPDPRLKQTLPEGWKTWVQEMMAFLNENAMYSPTVAKDLELLKLLPVY